MIVAAAGDMALELGTYSPVTPAQEVDHGRHLVMWKKAAPGSWKIYQDMTVSTAAPPAP